MLGETNLGQANACRLGGVLGRFTLCMTAEWRVHVIIRRKSHGHKLGKIEHLAKLLAKV